MFHVAPMIPALDEDPSRKRHIGNDVVVIIFRDSSDTQLDLSTIQSQFNRMSVNSNV